MRPAPSLLAAVAALALAPMAFAQGAAVAAPAAIPAGMPAVEVYEREVFRYARGGRPDPFQPLLTAAELGFRVEDLRLTSIVYSPTPRLSLAVFAESDSAQRRHRLRTGQRLGTMTVLRIYPQRVDVRIDEFGGSRVETILLRRAQRTAAPAAPMEIPVTLTPAPQQPQAPARPTPLRRGGSRSQQEQQQQPQSGAARATAPARSLQNNPRTTTGQYTRP